MQLDASEGTKNGGWLLAEHKIKFMTRISLFPDLNAIERQWIGGLKGTSKTQMISKEKASGLTPPTLRYYRGRLKDLDFTKNSVQAIIDV